MPVQLAAFLAVQGMPMITRDRIRPLHRSANGTRQLPASLTVGPILPVLGIPLVVRRARRLQAID